MTDAPKSATATQGELVVVATPIGNLEDITYRAVRTLGEVSLIAAEDTRRARILLARYDIRTPTVSLFAGNEARRTAELLRRLVQGERIALISDAGSPGVSDPGLALVARCLDEGIPVDFLPGPSAVVAALVLSGLPAARFTFLGFLPRKGPERRQILDGLRHRPETLVLFEAPGRVAATLADLAQALGDRPAAVARELTKLHQEVRRGRLGELSAHYAAEAPRGEVTLVVGGGEELPLGLGAEALAEEVARRIGRGESPKSIAAALGGSEGRRRVYQLALAAAGAKTDDNGDVQPAPGSASRES
ncbi:MAG: 16S rRNA (cytidine(1402)-2'-O)-methyltransferase [Deltaproteobacteria bacterium]|nr:16S rRNA (cytidine(1402)-2'-O)-methyltransferase [Deltaproteobacteria bacterium]